MKKALLVALLLRLFLWNQLMFAGTIEVNGINYEYYWDTPTNHNVAFVTSKLSGHYVGDIIIPASINLANGDECMVTGIKDYAFYNCTGLNTVAISQGVSVIGKAAFSGCSQLYSVIIPSTVTEIKDGAFYRCQSLASIKIPAGVTSIGDDTFLECSRLDSIYIPEGVTTIGESAFLRCVSLVYVLIPSSVKSIGRSSFEGCTNLIDVYCYAKEIPETGQLTFDASVVDNTRLHIPLGCKAAYESANLWKDFNCIIEMQPPSPIIAFSDSVVKAICVANWDTDGDGELSMEEAAVVTDLGNIFYDNEKITSFDELSYFIGLQQIKDDAFWGCRKLTSITIPESVAYIGVRAFEFCGLTALIIPKSVAVIEECAFYYNSDLVSIELPNSVEIIKKNAFYSCRSLPSIIIPTSVACIEENAFGGCSSLTSIRIPSSVYSIGDGAFSSCSSLSSIIVDEGNPVYDSRDGCNAIIETESNTLISGCKSTIIPENIFCIGNSAFKGCADLNSIIIPNSVKCISYYAFYNCSSLVSILIPAGITSIKDKVFSECASLSSIIVDEGNPVYDSRDGCNAIIETESNTLISGCKSTIIPKSVTKIGFCAFCLCRALESISIPDGVTTIGGGAFADCFGLASVTLPPSLKYIGNQAFEGCELASLTLPPGLMEIGWGAFRNCNSLTTIKSYIKHPYNVEDDVFEGINSNCILFIPVGTEALYYKVEGWDKFANIVEKELVTITADDKRRFYGDVNPILTYTSSTGNTINGIPSLLCDATKTSPVGNYDIIVSNGSVANNDVMYINGTLTITEAPLTIAIGTYTKKQYDSMPQFTVSYDGFKNSETDDALTQRPTISCEANQESAPGEYPIVVYGAEANNYAIQYISGKLIVTEPDSYMLTYIVDGEIYQQFMLKYKENIIPLEDPIREGHIFSGWSEIPKSMPAHDVTVTGSLKLVKFPDSFVADNMLFRFASSDSNAVVLVSMPEIEHAVVPEIATYLNYSFQVVGLADSVFYSNRQLKSIRIPASIMSIGKNVFGNCPNLSAIVWQPLMAIPASLLTDISNPNLLLYANASRWTDQVPSVISNKIHDSIAKSITLTDGYPFYCPQEFIAEQISYTHEYKQETVIGKCQGWETIALPFTVQTITHEDESKGKMAPFAANDVSARPFWLYSMQPSGEKFVPASVIRANTPYILSMPNNQEYVSRYNLAGKVTFSAKDATVEASTALHTIQRNATGYSVTFIPNYSSLAQTDDIMALNRDGVWQDNPQGSIFRSHRAVQPFEAYILWQGGAGVKEFRIADDNATDIRELFNHQSSIINPQIYDLSGRRIADGNKQVHSLRPGVYIHQGRKVLVK